MKTQIKICGLRTMADIALVNETYVDYAGFVFAPSKRRVTPEEARGLVKALDPRIKAIGVFVNTPPEEVNRIAEYCDLHIAQLHGEETPEACCHISLPVWKAITVKNAQSLHDADAYNDVAGVLLDGAMAGSGTVFDWRLVEGFAGRRLTILAGGLNAENVLLAIKRIRPQVVDVSTGVEHNGVKNKEKLWDFIRSVNAYET